MRCFCVLGTGVGDKIRDHMVISASRGVLDGMAHVSHFSTNTKSRSSVPIPPKMYRPRATKVFAHQSTLSGSRGWDFGSLITVIWRNLHQSAVPRKDGPSRCFLHRYRLSVRPDRWQTRSLSSEASSLELSRREFRRGFHFVPTSGPSFDPEGPFKSAIRDLRSRSSPRLASFTRLVVNHFCIASCNQSAVLLVSLSSFRSFLKARSSSTIELLRHAKHINDKGYDF